MAVARRRFLNTQAAIPVGGAAMKCPLLLTLASALGSAAGVDLVPVEPSLASVRNVVFTLIRGGDNGLDALIESHRCLHEAIDDMGAQYDHVVFHENNLEPDVLAEAPTLLPGVRFVSVAEAFVLPAGLQLPADVLSGEAEGSIGYRHMCHFMSMQWYQLLSRYEYAMRVDEDVCLQVRAPQYRSESHHRVAQSPQKCRVPRGEGRSLCFWSCPGASRLRVYG